MSRPVHRFLLAAVGFVVAVLVSACQTTASPGVTAATDTLATSATTTAAPVTSPATTTTTAATTTTSVTVPAHTTTKAKPKPPTSTRAAAPAKKKSTGACGSGYYRNSDGVCVHRPAPATKAPAGATAQCEDGTYSYSKHRRGTCSHHGGVSRWL